MHEPFQFSNFETRSCGVSSQHRLIVHKAGVGHTDGGMEVCQNLEKAKRTKNIITTSIKFG
jgi:hypothetical protein